MNYLEALKIIMKKKGENVPYLEITEVVLVHCNIVNNDSQQNSRALHKFVPNKPFGSLLEISPAKHIFLRTFNFLRNFKPLKYGSQIKIVNY